MTHPDQPRPEVLADGIDELDTVDVATIERPCPRCGAGCRFDPVAVVTDGEAVGWAHTTAILRLQERLLARLPFEVGAFDGHRTLQGADGVTPHVASLRCGECGAALLAVVSWGEVQPARYRLVFDGVIAADDPSPPKASGRERVIGFGVIALTVGLLVWLHAAVVVEWQRSTSLAADGVAVQGEVIETESLAGPRSDGYRVTYRYVAPAADGRPTQFTATRDVDRATYDSMSVGYRIEVRYDPEDPQRSDVARNDRLAMMLFIVGILDLLLAVAAVRIVQGVRQRPKGRRPQSGASEEPAERSGGAGGVARG